MKSRLIILCYFITCDVAGQLIESFEIISLNNWQQSPPERWSISENQPLSGNFSLHHVFDNDSLGCDRISFQHDVLHLDSSTTTWQFKIRHGYAPSSNNNWVIFLVADDNSNQMTIKGNCNGYAIGVNLTGYDDCIKLWKVTDNKIEPIVTSYFNWQEKIGTEKPAELKITRNKYGKWTIYIDPTCTGSNYRNIGEGTDTEILTSNYFGIYYKYTSGLDQKLWFDDLAINGDFSKDTIPPEIITFKVINNTSIQLKFNEKLEALGITTKNIVPRFINFVDSIGITGDFISIWFNQPFRPKVSYTLIIKNFSDVYGNFNPADTVSFIYYQAGYNDLVLTEIMADPFPPVLLPEAEYVELYNRCKYPINLEDCKIQIGNHSAVLPGFIILPDEYLILCDSEYLPLFSKYGTVLPVTNFPSLSNKGQEIVIRNNENRIIFTSRYDSKWYSSTYKSDGGWSLEIIDTDNPCAGRNNWQASDDNRGGTPGMQNSISGNNPDLTDPELLKVIIINDSVVHLLFSEQVDSNGFSDIHFCKINNGVGNPLSVKRVNFQFNTIELLFETVFIKNTVYSLLLKNEIFDCSGNSISPETTANFRKSSDCNNFDLVFNEILFDPFEAGCEFIEIFNRSEKVIDIKNFKLGLTGEIPGEISQVYDLIGYHYTLYPGEYLALTENRNLLLKTYYCKNVYKVLEINKLPVLPNKQGDILLLDAGKNKIDEFIYSDDLHYSLITNQKGISLERVDCDQPTNSPENWHSSSAGSGFATPGYENSQNKNNKQENDEIVISPDIFSPDFDGYDDIVTISYHLSEPGFVANIMVFDRYGYLVKKIATNLLLGTKGTFTWNGINETGGIAPIGAYLIYTEIFNASGKVKKFKNTCVLAKKVN